MFGYIQGEAAELKNLGLEEVNIRGEGDVGGVAGWNLGSGTVQNSYATGNVEGESYVGGVAGYNIGILENCVALNLNIKANATATTTIGRVVGDVNAFSTMQDNHARSDMALKYGSDNQTYNPIPDVDWKDGATVSSGTDEGQYNNLSFWRDTLGWDFDATWQWPPNSGPDSLPVLRDVGGVQNPRAP